MFSLQAFVMDALALHLVLYAALCYLWEETYTTAKEDVPVGSKESTKCINENSDRKKNDGNKTNTDITNIIVLKKDMIQLSRQVEAQANAILTVQTKHEQQPKSTLPQQFHNNSDFISNLRSDFTIMTNFIKLFKTVQTYRIL